MDNKLNLIAFLATLAAIVAMVLGAAFIPDEMTQIAGTAITGLIGVIGTFRPRGVADAPKQEEKDV